MAYSRGADNGRRSAGKGNDRGNGAAKSAAKSAGKGAGKAPRRKRSPAVRTILISLKIIAVIILAIMFSAAGIVGGAIIGYSTTAPDITDEQLSLKTLTTFIYDEKGNVIARLTGRDNKNMERVDDKDIPQFLKDAYISIEDERFEQHNGVDLQGFIRAVFRKLKNPSVPMQGGSTITMQLVRNITERFERTIPRKIQECMAAYKLELRMPKWKILESYMNIIFMGHSCYGVQSASKTYFGKSVKDLSLAECALLAGITNSPGDYDPFTEKGLENAKKREILILDKMLELGHIDQAQYDQAVKEEINIVDPEERTSTATVQSYFVDYVISDFAEDLAAQKNISKQMAMAIIYNNGLKIYTTQNSDMQASVDEVFTDDKYFPMINNEAKKLQEHSQAATVIIDHKNGQIKAMYGGYGEKKASNTLNRATQLKRQPGSSIKPIAVYGPSVDLRLITPASIIDDVPVYMMTTGPDKDKPYPTNYDGDYNGLTSVRNALRASINTVAARIWRDILGPDRSIEYLKKVGIDRSDEKYVSLVMGGLHTGVNPLQMAAAYIPFANKGIYYEPISYTKVIDSDGKTMIEKKAEYNPVYEEVSAYVMTNMLKEVVTPTAHIYPHGATATRCKLQGGKMPVAGKTGTTSENIDKWFIGYTPYYVAATWYGYDNRYQRKAIKLTRDEYNQAQIIWQAVMEKIHKDLPVKDFEEPAGIVKKRICTISGKIATELCTKDPRGDASREEIFIKGAEPKDLEYCDIHVLGKVCKASKDTWNRYLLASPYCPPDQLIEGVFIQRAVQYVPVKPEEKQPTDIMYELPAAEYCTVHSPYNSDTDSEMNIVDD